MSKAIIVTGAGRGIGAQTALLAATKGYAVCVNYMRDHASANQIVEQIKNNNGNAIAVQADVSKQSEVERLFTTVDDTLGTLSALVNNAAILDKQTRVEDIDEARLNKIFTTNITSCFLCAKEAIRRMSTKHQGRGGAIVNVSSVASRTGSPNEYVDYAASKGAIDTLTTGLSLEVADQGIRVNCVRPGFIYTDMHASGGEPDRVRRLEPVIPMRRGGQADEVANTILWLLSDEASYVTGSFIDLAGGK